MLEQTVSTAEFWKSVPWGWLTALFVAFIAGQFVQDLYNPKSWIRENWREWTGFFTVTRYNVIDDKIGGLKSTASIKLSRNIRHGKIFLRLYWGTWQHKPTKCGKVIFLQDIKSGVKGEEISIPIAWKIVSPVHQSHTTSALGRFDENDPTPFDYTSKNIVEIFIKGWFFTQKVKFLVQSQTSGAFLLYVLCEDDEVFGIEE